MDAATRGEGATGESPAEREGALWGCAQAGEAASPKAVESQAHEAARPAGRGGIE